MSKMSFGNVNADDVQCFKILDHETKDHEQICRDYTKILQRDKELMEVFSKWQRFEENILRLLFRTEDEGDKVRVVLTGSMVEGAGICRSLSHNFPFLECDVMYVTAVIPKENNAHIVESIPEKPGFYKIKICSDHNLLLKVQRSPRMRQIFNEFQKCNLIGETYYTPTHAVMLANQMSKAEVPVFPYATFCAMDCLFQGRTIDMECIKTLNGPAITWHYICKEKTMTVLSHSIDRIVAFEAADWPPEAKGWSSRKRNWPDEITVEKAFQTPVLYIPKADTNDWRISFSQVEIVLAKARTDVMNVCFLVAKAIFYFYVKCINDKDVSSYWLKTSMLWAQEAIPISSWTNDNLGNNLRVIYNRLATGLRCHSIKNYFIDKLNILDDKPRNLTAQVADVAEHISNDPLHYARLCLMDCKQRLEVHNNFHILDNFTETFVKCMKLFGFMAGVFDQDIIRNIPLILRFLKICFQDKCLIVGILKGIWSKRRTSHTSGFSRN